MTQQVAVTEAPAPDLSARLQERIRSFTAFYEQHAYLAYNLALRIVCQPEPATRAVQWAFLSQLDDRSAGLLPATVGAALHEASSHPQPSGAGDPEAQRLMAAMAELAPPERAALALADLAHAGPDAIGSALSLDAGQAGKLLHRGREAFAAQLGLPRSQADEAAREWMWAAPPEEIWQELYPQFHRAVERDLRRGGGEQTLVLSAAEASAQTAGPRPRLRGLRPRRRLRGRRWLRRPRSRIVLIAAIVLALGAVAGARLLHSGATAGHPNPSGDGAAAQASDGGFDAGTSAPAPSEPPVKPHKPLTPAELDKLRLRELAQLKAYTKRQANKRLPASQRNAAAHGIATLQHSADRRLQEELRREQVLRDQLARERARAHAPPPPPPPPRSQTTTPSRTQAPQRQGTTPSGSGPDTQNCLYDQDSGQYVCPQQ